MKFLFIAAVATTTSARPWGWVENQDTDHYTTMSIPTETYPLNIQPPSGDGPTRPYSKPSTELAYYDQNELAEAEHEETSAVEVLVANSEIENSEKTSEPISKSHEVSNEDNIETIISVPDIESGTHDARDSETEDLMNELPADANAENSENGYRSTLDRLSGKEINTFVAIEETRVINVPGNSDVVHTKPELKLDYYRNVIAEDHLHIASIFLAGLVFVTVGGVIFSRFRMQQNW